MSGSGIDRFMAMIGGEANLPPVAEIKEPTPKGHEQAENSSNDLNKDLPTVEEVVKQQRDEAAAKAKAKARRKQLSETPAQSTPAITALPYAPSEVRPVPNLEPGQTAPSGIHFSPFLAVTRFCYKFVKPEWLQPLATAFFDANKIYARPWDIYYVHSKHHETVNPTTFVPEHQLQALINDINEAFPDAKISITEAQRDDGLVLDFDDLPDILRPQWEGRSTSRAQYDEFVYTVPKPVMPAGKMPNARSLQEFKEMIEAAVELGKAKSKGKRKANLQVQIQRRQDMNKQVLRAQRYLGLLQKAAEDATSAIDNLIITPADPNSPPQYSFDMDAIFVSFDVEAYERSPKTITEVGLATLDTRDLKGEAPGPIGENWHKHVRARHFRVVEYKHLCNKEFVNGCPDNFEFGESEFIGKENLPSVLASCFHEPYSKKDAPNSRDDEKFPTLSSAMAAKTGGERGDRSPEAQEEKRSVVLLGHDINQDIAYLNSIGFSVTNRSGLLDSLDTAIMMRSYMRDPQPTSLGKILYHFDMPGWHLHNAGNDAVYTMHAMLAIAVKAATERGSEEVEQKHAEALEKHKSDAIEAAKEKVLEEAEGWVTNMTDDGGVAVVPTAEDLETMREKAKRTVFGPPEPPKTRFYTTGGAPLDV